MDTRQYREIEVLRRLLFSLSATVLLAMREEFIDDVEARDYIDWLIRRQEML